MTSDPTAWNRSSSTPKGGRFAARQGCSLVCAGRRQNAAVVIAVNIDFDIRGFVEELEGVGSVIWPNLLT